MRISDIDTPALIVDLDRVENNLRRVADYARNSGLKLRPHTKTHKTPEFGRMQLDSGAYGLTVAKVSEAEVMLASGVEDLLIAYPLVSDRKAERAAEVAKKVRLTVALDSREALDCLSRKASAAGVEIGVLVEADVGMKRCGVEPGPALLALAQAAHEAPGVALRGFAFYPGHVWPPDPDGPEQLEKLAADVARIRDDFQRAGLPLDVVSGGSSPTLFHSHKIQGMTEIRPGTVIFGDRMQVEADICTFDDCAATILTTVVSTPRENFAIIDGGSKTFTSDGLRHTQDPTFGRIVEAPEARFTKMNEEHGYLDLSAVDRPVRIGDRLRVLPNHICVAVNMHERIHAVRGDQVEHIWEVRGHGKLQ